jgi:adenylylsulfate kinase
LRSGGLTIWITGLSGAGKTSVANLVAATLRDGDLPVVLLDGDELRGVFGDGHGYDREDRLYLAAAYGRLCALLAGQGLIVVCATISLFSQCHRWNRANIPGYFEVYLKVPMEILADRDPKRLHDEARKGQMPHFHGYDLDFDEPRHPDLVIENHGTMTAEATAKIILDRIASESAMIGTGR